MCSSGVSQEHSEVFSPFIATVAQPSITLTGILLHWYVLSYFYHIISFNVLNYDQPCNLCMLEVGEKKSWGPVLADE